MKTISIVLLVLMCSLFFSSCSKTGEDKFPEQHTYSEIYSMNVDGTGLTKLTSDKKDITFMQYLPKSDKILFVQDSGTYIMNSDGGQRLFLSAKSLNKSTRITQDEQTAYFFNSETSSPKVYSILYSMSLSTGKVKQLVQDSSYIVRLGISTDGSQLIYSTYSPLDTSFLFLLNIAALQKRKIKEWTDTLYCDFPQFVPNSDQIIFFEKINIYRIDSYLRIMDLADTSNSQILDTVNIYYEYSYPALNLKGEIFYAKNGITVLNVTTNQKVVIPSMFRTDLDYANWSYDGTKLIATDHFYNQMIIYTPTNGSTTNVRPSVGSNNAAPYAYPYLNLDNKKIFFTVFFTETVLI